MFYYKLQHFLKNKKYQNCEVKNWWDAHIPTQEVVDSFKEFESFLEFIERKEKNHKDWLYSQNKKFKDEFYDPLKELLSYKQTELDIKKHEETIKDIETKLSNWKSEQIDELQIVVDTKLTEEKINKLKEEKK